MWYNKYIGLPYQAHGRDYSGLDCWGLVRLVYDEQFNIKLPSFSTEYLLNDYNRIDELIAQYKEGWTPTTVPSEGDVLLFKMMGADTHVGIALNNKDFLHIREGKDSVIDSLDNGLWHKRLIGSYKYTSETSAHLTAIPHPLKTIRITVPVPQGTTIGELKNWIQQEYGSELPNQNIHIVLNGDILDDNSNNIVVKTNDIIEYRSVPQGGSFGRMLLMVAVVLAAPYVAGYLAGATLGTTAAAYAAAGLAPGAAATISVAAANALTMGVTMAGMMLVNAISPIRPPEDPGQAAPNYISTGSGNAIIKFESVPFVLGTVRMTPPQGANSYSVFDGIHDNYLKTVYVWGYAPLSISTDSIRIGEIPLTNYTNYTTYTLSEYSQQATWSTLDTSNLIPIYGGDASQAYSGQNILNDIDVTTEAAPAVPQIVTVSNLSETNTGTAKYYSNQLILSIHFPQGCRKVSKKDGKSSAAPVKLKIEYSFNGTTWSNFSNLSSNDSGSTDASGYITIGGGAAIKDAFTETLTTVIGDTRFNIASTSPTTVYVRVKRYTSSRQEQDGNDYNYYWTSTLHTLTSLNNQKPVKDGTNFKFARTALSILTTEQLNGRQDAFNALVSTQARIWNGTSWASPESTTNNPAALFLHVLTHPANQMAISSADESTKIDLAQLGYWYNYCVTKGFTFNTVISQTRSLLEVLRDIAAAGRASPALINGKWTVTIDEPKSKIIQLFTPQNSWGFESTKAIPKYPDALRVQFYDETKDYQENEVVVYANGKTESNSSLYETISFPGVTKVAACIDHARWQLAQAKIRSEIFTLNVDLEYLVCTRGDRVKVQHDIPMWGTASGRINKVFLDSGHYRLKLDSVFLFDPSKQYTLLVRKNTVDPTTRFVTISSANILGAYNETNNTTLLTAAGYSNTLRISSTAYTTLTGTEGCLVALGEVNKVTQDLLVIGVQPNQNMTAQLTLIDYGILSTADGFTGLDSNNEISIFSNYLTYSSNTFTYNANISDISIPQKELLTDVIPQITSIISDSSMLTLVSGNVISNMRVSVGTQTTSKVPLSIAQLQIEYKQVGASKASTIFSNSSQGYVDISDVDDGTTYQLRARYINKDGYFSAWTNWINHTVIGKTEKPASVTNFNYTFSTITNLLTLSWTDNTELDLAGYEIRTNTNFGQTGYLWKGKANTFSINLTAQEWQNTTFYIKAIDTSNNYSTNYSSTLFNTTIPNNVSNINYSYGQVTSTLKQSLTTNNININWTAAQLPSTGQLPIKGYRVIIHNYNSDTTTISSIPTANILVDTTINGTDFNTTVNWDSTARVIIKTVDIINTESNGIVANISKSIPGLVGNISVDVADNVITLSWSSPTVSTNSQLPINTYYIYEASTNTQDYTQGTLIGTKSGLFTTITKILPGTFKYWVIAVDSSGTLGLAGTGTSLYSVSGPPDYQLAYDITSNLLSGTQTNVLPVYDSSSGTEVTSVVFPVSISETWTSHWTNIAAAYPGTDTFQEAITVGYDYFLSPNTAETASYIETFVLPDTLSSGTVSLIYEGYTLEGNVTISVKIEEMTSGNYQIINGSSGRMTNIKTLKVTLTMTDINTGALAEDGLVQIKQLRLIVDTKTVTDGGNRSVDGGDFVAGGSFVTLSKAIPIIDSIVLTPQNTGSAIIPSYSINTTSISGTMTSVLGSNEATITLSSGTFGGGTTINLYIYLTIIGAGCRTSIQSGFYRVTQVINSTTIKIYIGVPPDNTSGSLTQSISYKEQFFKVYLYDTNNNGVTLPEVGWLVKGYR